MTLDQRRTAGPQQGRTSTVSGPGRPDLARTLPRGSRRYGQWVGTVLFVVVMALAAAWLYQSKGDTTEVLVVKRPVAAGEAIGRGDLGTAQVSGVADAVPVAETGTVVGQRARVGLVEGQVITTAALTSDLVPGEGQKLVAIRLDRGRVPDGFASGAVVDVLAVPLEGGTATESSLDDPPVLEEAAEVHAVKSSVDGGFVVSLLVDAADADRVAAYGAAGRVTIVQAPVAGE